VHCAEKLFELQIFQYHKTFTKSQASSDDHYEGYIERSEKPFIHSEVVSNHQHKFFIVEKINQTCPNFFVGFYFSPVAPRPWLRMYMGWISVRLWFKSQLKLKAKVLHIKELPLLPLEKILSAIS
jgi:hypothetical protein